VLQCVNDVYIWDKHLDDVPIQGCIIQLDKPGICSKHLLVLSVYFFRQCEYEWVVIFQSISLLVISYQLFLE